MLTTRILIGIGLGLAAGAIGGALMKRAGGTCPLTCNPIGGAVAGAALGWLIASMIGGSGGGADALNRIEGEEQFAAEVLRAEGLVVVDFYQDGCPPCSRLAPVLSELQQELGPQVHFRAVDVRTNGTLAEKYQVQATPTVLLFHTGQVIDGWRGYRNKADARRTIEGALAEIQPQT
jgi:thioredoxin 1